MRSGGVILVGHGRFAEGLLTPLEMLAGVPEYFAGIGFPAGMAEDVTVVTGTNLPVVLQLAMLPEWTGVPENLEELVAAGREALRVVRY